jgi:uncharacterized membrane protein
VFRAVPLPSVLLKQKIIMRKYFIATGLLSFGLYCGVISFNHIDAWFGLGVTFIVIGIFLNYIYKQIKNYYNEKN